jgi:drug/metabolite transporter (DMT)-like permease
MDIKIFLLVIVSALLHSFWNVLLKKEQDTSASSVALAILACAYALIFGIPSIQTIYPQNILVPVILAGLCAGGALWCQGMAFRTGLLGLTYAVNRSGAILLLWPISYFVLGETATVLDYTGVFILTFALTAILMKGKKVGFDKNLWWALLGALFIVGYNIFYKQAISRGGNPLTVLGFSDVLRIIVAFALIDGNRISRVAKTFEINIRPIIIMSLASFGSFGIFLFALKYEGAARLGTLRNLSILFTALGSLKIGEKLTAYDYILILLTISGTILIGI